MRQAMANAVLGGDDCYGDDPSVNELQARAAELVGKEAALFCPTGTMSNQLAVRTHTTPGETVVAPATSHVEVHEEGSAAALSGANVSALAGATHHYEAQHLRERILEEEHSGWPRVGLAWIENTLGLAGGRVWPQSSVIEIAQVARSYGRPVHIDGARLWNACAASGLSLSELAAPATSVSFSLSKGLGCPAGSLLCGPAAFIEKARGHRHALGGAMRQSGILAAAGLWALEAGADGHARQLSTLRADHARAKRLAELLSPLDVWDVQMPETNILLLEPRNPALAAEDLCAPLRAVGVLCYPNRYRQVRLVMHWGIDDAALEEIAARARKALSAFA